MYEENVNTFGRDHSGRICIKFESDDISLREKMTILTELGSSTHSNAENDLENNKTLCVNCFFLSNLCRFSKYV